MKVFKFGIQEKTALLVVVVAVACASAVAVVLQRISARMVEKHELVDLSDEAGLRAWEIIDQFNSLREDLGRLATDDEIQRLSYDDPDRMRIDLADRITRLCRQWPSYLSVEMVDNSGVNDPISIVNEIQGLDGSHRDRLVAQSERLAGRSPVFVSPIHRVQAEVVAPGGDGGTNWREKWAPLVWGCTRIEPPAMYDGPTRFLVITMELQAPSSPRHLFFIVDANDEERQPYIIHPNMSIAQNFGEDGMFASDLRADLKAHARKENLAHPQRIERVALLEKTPLASANHFFFIEGLPRPALQNALDQRLADDPETHEAYLANMEARYESMGRRLGGMSGQVREVRMLASDPADLERGSSTGAQTFLNLVEDELRQYAELPSGGRLIDWKDIVPCRHCHISCLHLHVDTAEGPKKYLMMYAAFQEEFVGAIQHEIRSGLAPWMIVFAVGSLAIAFTASLFFLQPLREMTKTAQHVAAEEGDLQVKISELSATLPTRRKDEVGDIARASKRLFDEVVASQVYLEDRIDERTRELKEANEQLEGLGKEKDAFLANVSHELRTPLTAVSGFLQLLKRKKLEEKNANYVAKALSGAALLEALIDDILDFQKIIMGGLTLEASEFELQQLLAEIEESMQFHARKNSNRFEFRCDESLSPLETDRLRLRQVLANIVSNACKFTRNGAISIEAVGFERDDADWVRLRIADTGRGMDEAEQKKLFTRFHTNKTANASGTGLGLVICEGLCKLMGGSLILERSAPGEGSTFLAELPRRLPEVVQEVSGSEGQDFETKPKINSEPELPNPEPLNP